MNKLLVVSVFLLALLPLSSGAAIVRFGGISDNANVMFVNIESGRELTDAKISVYIPELNVGARRNVDFSRSLRQSVNVQLPLDEFDDYVRVVFSSDEGRMVKYYPLVTNKWVN